MSFDDSGESNDGVSERSSGRLSGAKLKALEQVLEEAQRGGEKVLVFSLFKRYLDLIDRALAERGVEERRIARLDGSMSARARDQEVQKFRRKRSCDIFLISTKAGGLGLNLTAASTVVIMEPGWNPTDEEQAVCRAYRMGQTKRVRVVRFLVTGTIESMVVNLQREKRSLAQTVLSAERLARMIKGEGD